MPQILDYDNLTAARRPFNLIELTKGINQSPYMAGFFQSIQMFRERAIPTTSFTLEYRDSKIELIESTKRGAVLSTPSVTEGSTRKMLTLTTAHLEIVKELTAESVQNVRAFGVDDEVESRLIAITEKRDELLAEMRASISATIEYMMVGALKGEVRDGKNNLLVNLFNEFNITQTTVAINMSKPIASEMSSVFNAMRTAVGGSGIVSELLAVCGATAYQKLLEKAIDETKSRADDSPIDFGNVQVAGFIRGGVKFVQYPGGVGNTSFINANDVHYVPLVNGLPMPGLFEIYYAPADYAETVNTLGLPFYAKSELLPYGKGFALNVQSNPMPICTRPKTLIKSTIP